MNLTSNPCENPELTGMNRLPARATLYPFQNIEDALSMDRTKSPWFQSLNGNWKFKLFSKPEEVPQLTFDPDYDDSQWREIIVPGCWTMQDTGDYPKYTNVRMPFDHQPPFVPEENPSGVYRTDFTCDPSWRNRRNVIHFAGVESAWFVYLNGKQIGFSKGSRTPVEFDLTDFVTDGVNTLAVMVIRWSDGSFIEDQDHWWMAGIHRDVYLYSTQKAYVQDLFAIGHLDDDYKDGKLDIKLKIENENEIKELHNIDVHLIDPDGKLILFKKNAGETKGLAIRYTSSKEMGHEEKNIRIKYEISNPLKWTDETPNLYKLVIVLKNESEEIIEFTSTRLGFRRIEIKNKEMLINGKPVMMKGVNRHDHDDITGKNCQPRNDD